MENGSGAGSSGPVPLMAHTRDHIQFGKEREIRTWLYEYDEDAFREAGIPAATEGFLGESGIFPGLSRVSGRAGAAPAPQAYGEVGGRHGEGEAFAHLLGRRDGLHVEVPAQHGQHGAHL